jgi:hypothetical protein
LTGGEQCVLSEAAIALNALSIRKDKFNNKNFTQAACVKFFKIYIFIKKTFTQPACVKINNNNENNEYL